MNYISGSMSILKEKFTSKCLKASLLLEYSILVIFNGMAKIAVHSSMKR